MKQICDFCKKKYEWNPLWGLTGRILIFTEHSEGLTEFECHICEKCQSKLTVMDFLNKLRRVPDVVKPKTKPEKEKPITAKDRQKMLDKLLQSIEEGKRKIE